MSIMYQQRSENVNFLDHSQTESRDRGRATKPEFTRLFAITWRGLPRAESNLPAADRLSISLVTGVVRALNFAEVRPLPSNGDAATGTPAGLESGLC